jgi:hypothetical protein
MELLRPRTLGEELGALAERVGALPVAGGTDGMVDLNFGRCLPAAVVVDVSRLPRHGRPVVNRLLVTPEDLTGLAPPRAGGVPPPVPQAPGPRPVYEYLTRRAAKRDGQDGAGPARRDVGKEGS